MIDTEAVQKRKAQQKEYRSLNKDKIAARKKEHYLKNKERILLRMKKYTEKKKSEKQGVKW